ncbi:hypothetical protein GUJ93_ZPchr0009g260 [Zizania palustris]|uniref:Uncharacterized protein n=1 Tax=Zizania palustris TaxID=103762 RepID=A0A8J5RQ77_ZIZPA|nr:hypothetical protein GUJ93_ZPchr0009g260 [Zizania palustris]
MGRLMHSAYAVMDLAHDYFGFFCIYALKQVLTLKSPSKAPINTDIDLVIQKHVDGWSSLPNIARRRCCIPMTLDHDRRCSWHRLRKKEKNIKLWAGKCQKEKTMIRQIQQNKSQEDHLSGLTPGGAVRWYI